MLPLLLLVPIRPYINLLAVSISNFCHQVHIWAKRGWRTGRQPGSQIRATRSGS